MRKKALNLLRMLCVVLTLASLLAACGGGKGNSPIETTAEPQASLNCTFSDFQIIRSDIASSDITGAIIELNRTIKEVFGKSLPYKSDLLEKDETAFEILIGNTSRAETAAVAETLQAGDYTIEMVRTENGAKLVILGYTDDLTLDALAMFSDMVRENSLEENGVMKSLSIRMNLYDQYSDFTLNISDPILVSQADTYDKLGWGPYQFPYLYFTPSGSIYCSWGVGGDRIDGGGTLNLPSAAVSDDGGLTWRAPNPGDKISYVSRSQMSNGRYFAGFVGKNAYVVENLDQNFRSLMTTYENKKLFLPSELARGGVLDLTYQAQEYDPNTGKVTTFPCKINWPNQLISVYYGGSYANNTIHPPQRELALGSGLADLAVGDKLYYVVYARGLDPETGKLGKYSEYFSSFIFCSEDNARTWNLVSQINVNDEIIAESKKHPGHFEGFGEASMSLMPDGSIVLLVRTGSNQPCYIMRSTDGCKTWSKPVKFDEVGVRPFIMTLDCGVSLASYGRDGLFVRATSDPSGVEWQDHIEISFNRYGGTKSCYYTYILPLSKDSALLVYSDFYYTPTGKPEDIGKSIVVRFLTVVPNKT